MLKEKTKFAANATGAVLVCAAALAYWSPWSADPTLASSAGKGYYTVDDGATWFADDAANIPPFTRDGKEADRAYVFRCGSGKPFVNHLERFKPSAKAAMEESQSPNRHGPPNIPAIKEAGLGGREVKRPGDKAWTNCGDFRAASKITSPKCPDAGTDPTPVEP